MESVWSRAHVCVYMEPLSHAHCTVVVVFVRLCAFVSVVLLVLHLTLAFAASGNNYRFL